MMMHGDSAALATFGQVKFLVGTDELTSGSNGHAPSLIMNDEYLGGYAALFTVATIGKGN